MVVIDMTFVKQQKKDVTQREYFEKLQNICFLNYIKAH